MCFSQKLTQITTCGRSPLWFHRGVVINPIVGIYIAVINIKRNFLWFSKPIPLANSWIFQPLQRGNFQVWRIMSPRWIPRSCGTIVLILPVAYGVTLCFSIRKKSSMTTGSSGNGFWCFLGGWELFVVAWGGDWKPCVREDFSWSQKKSKEVRRWNTRPTKMLIHLEWFQSISRW